MGVVFKREDFTLCDVPVPKGYPQSQTHVGIGVYNGNYFMTTSPFPNPQRSRFQLYANEIIKRLTKGHVNLLYKGEDYENPCLYLESKRNKAGIPIAFRLLGDGPLMEKPIDKYGKGSYCSDPDLFIKDDVFNILNRTSIRKDFEGEASERYETNVYLISGRFQNESIIKKEIFHLFSERYVSPCLFYYCNKYVYFCLDTNTYNDGKACEALYIRESADMKVWSEMRRINLKNGNYEPWHMSVFSHKDKLYSILACVKRGESHRCWQMLGEFNEDLTELRVFQTPLTDYKSYRGSAMVRSDGEFLLYNPTVREIIDKGKSIDGREIIVAHMPFDVLLNFLYVHEQ